MSALDRPSAWSLPDAGLLGLLEAHGHVGPGAPGWAAAVEQVAAARRQVGLVRVEVEDVAVRLLPMEDIPWSGSAARAWRDRVAAARRTVRAGVDELDGLDTGLTLLAERLHR